MLKPLELFAQEMRCRRRQEGLSQEGFAEKTGVSMALVSEIERGIANPTLQTLEKIAAYFQTEVAEMIKCTDGEENIAFIKINLIKKIIGLDRADLEKVSKFIAKM